MPLGKLLNDSPRLAALLADESDALHLRRVLELIVLQREPLTSASMAALLGTQRDKIDDVLDALRPALATDNRGCVQLNDPRFADYLAEPRLCADQRFAVDKTSADLDIAAFCLELLSRELRPNMCGLQNAAEATRRMEDMGPSESEELRGRIPAHFTYAGRFLASHVCGSNKAVDSNTAMTIVHHATWPNLLKRIESFSTTSMLFWIEVLAAAAALDTLQAAAAGLVPLLSHSKEALALFTEAATLLDRFPELGIDDRTLASGSSDKTMKLWEASTGKLLRSLEGHSGWVRSVALSSDGRTVASGSDDKTIKLWEVTTGRLLHTLEGHSAEVWSVTFSNDGRTLASGSRDKTVKLWEAATGRLLRTLKGHSSSVMAVTFSSNVHTLASGSYDQTIKLYRTAT